LEPDEQPKDAPVQALARALVRLEVRAEEGAPIAPGWLDTVEAGGEMAYEASKAPTEAFEELLSKMVDDLLTEYLSRQHLRDADPTRLSHLIAQPTTPETVDLQLEAIRLARERRIQGVADALLDVLDHDDERIRDGALGALLALRDRRAVTRLGETRSMRDTHEMHKILDAIAVLGGPEAASYLSFVAEAHEDPEIRARAEAARQRLADGAKP
jgi:hypothetical protein